MVLLLNLASINTSGVARARARAPQPLPTIPTRSHSAQPASALPYTQGTAALTAAQTISIDDLTGCLAILKNAAPALSGEADCLEISEAVHRACLMGRKWKDCETASKIS
jgi:hypothetical protein